MERKDAQPNPVGICEKVFNALKIHPTFRPLRRITYGPEPVTGGPQSLGADKGDVAKEGPTTTKPMSSLPPPAMGATIVPITAVPVPSPPPPPPPTRIAPPGPTAAKPAPSTSVEPTRTIRVGSSPPKQAAMTVPIMSKLPPPSPAVPTTTKYGQSLAKPGPPPPPPPPPPAAPTALSKPVPPSSMAPTASKPAPPSTVASTPTKHMRPNPVGPTKTKPAAPAPVVPTATKFVMPTITIPVPQGPTVTSSTTARHLPQPPASPTTAVKPAPPTPARPTAASPARHTEHNKHVPKAEVGPTEAPVGTPSAPVWHGRGRMTKVASNINEKVGDYINRAKNKLKVDSSKDEKSEGS